MKKNIEQKRNKKTTILLSLMFLTMICPKAWGYAEKDLPPSFSDKPFSSDDNLSFSSVVLSGPDFLKAKFTNETFAFSRAVLTDENGVAICQVNLVENPEFLPQFAEPGASDLEPLDLPECEQQNLDVVAQYAEQAWVKKEVAIAPIIVTGALAFGGGCTMGVITRTTTDALHLDTRLSYSIVLPSIAGGMYGAFVNLPSLLIEGSGWLKLGTTIKWTGVGAISGLVCYGITDLLFYE